MAAPPLQFIGTEQQACFWIREILAENGPIPALMLKTHLRAHGFRFSETVFHHVTLRGALEHLAAVPGSGFEFQALELEAVAGDGFQRWWLVPAGGDGVETDDAMDTDGDE